MPNDTILIVASSGRMLAQSARRAGLTPLVIDLFADLDTRELAADVQTVNELCPAHILPVIDHYISRYGVQDVVYGSGFETYPESLELMGKKLSLKGNTFQSLSPLLDKKKFFKGLTALDINYPQVAFKPFSNGDGWLVKPLAGEGGIGIKHHAGATLVDQRGNEGFPINVADHYYWQRYIEGIPMSVLFLADKEKVHIIGFNQQWTKSECYIFSGVMSQAALPAEKKELIQNWVEKLASAFSLKGLNSLDFIWDGDRCWVLEINPRPSASMILYDGEFPKGLLYEHLNACNGKFVNLVNAKTKITACHIIYSEKEQRITAGIHWPEWSMDRPVAGTLIRTNHPICSIIASGNRPQEVYKKLKARQQIMINKLEG